MATITTILGTDSLSSSRIVLNDNFTAINDQVEDLANLLDVSSETLTLTGTVNVAGISVAAGGTNRLIVNSSGITFGLETTIEDTLILDAGLRHSFTEASLMPSAQNYLFTTYVLDGLALSGTNVVAAGEAGQEITLIAEGANVAIDVTNIIGPTVLTINQNGTLTLRWYDGAWYIISSFNCAITL